VKQSAQHIQPSAPITSVARSGNAVRELKQPQYRLRELKAGDAVDVESVLNDSPPPHDVVATSQVTLLSMSADEFRR
jgi:CRP-like cAMP-binding protein